MASNGTATPDTAAILQEILSSVKSLRQEHVQLASSVDAINGRVNTLAGIKQINDGVAHDANLPSPKITASPKDNVSSLEGLSKDAKTEESQATSPPPGRRGSTTGTSKIILTTHPGQAGVDPIPLKWGKASIHTVLSMRPVSSQDNRCQGSQRERSCRCHTQPIHHSPTQCHWRSRRLVQHLLRSRCWLPTTQH